jgi:hypothetical protein
MANINRIHGSTPSALMDRAAETINYFRPIVKVVSNCLGGSPF